MSDDLVKRLRQSWDADRGIISQTGQWMTERKEAADRIEQLEAERDAAYKRMMNDSLDPEMDMVNWQLGFDEGYKRGLEDAAKIADEMLRMNDLHELGNDLTDFVRAIRAKIQESDG